jgi:hypothetical protein
VDLPAKFIGVRKVSDSKLKQFVSTVTRYFGCPAVCKNMNPGANCYQDPVIGIFRQSPECLFTLAKCLFGIPAFFLFGFNQPAYLPGYIVDNVAVIRQNIMIPIEISMALST